jgi:hypothetical protein
MPAPNAVKMSMSPTSRYQLHQRALREGRTDAAMALRLVESGLAASGPQAAQPSVSLDTIERNAAGATVMAAYLSGPLATAVKNLAADEGRTQSAVLRDLLRCELRRRGLLPNGAYGAAPALADATQ